MKAINFVAFAILLAGCADHEEPVSRYHPMSAAVDTQTVRSGTFARGDGPERVRGAMGPPEATNVHADGSEVWNYKFSSVTFRGGRVTKWNDVSKVLRVRGAGETGEHIVSKSGPSRVVAASGGAVPDGIAGPTGPGGTVMDSRYINPDQVRVNAHTRSDGTRVDSYIRTRGNATTRDNIRGR